MIQLRCPNCGTPNQVPPQQGATTVCCYACRQVFPLAAGTSGGAPYGAGSPGPPALPPQGNTGYGGAYPGAGRTPPVPAAPTPSVLPPHLASAGADPAAMPQAAPSIPPGEEDDIQADDHYQPPPDARSNWQPMILVLLAATFVLIGSALLVVLLVVGRSGSNGSTPWSRPNEPTDGGASSDLGGAQWTDARDKSLAMGAIQVRVDRAEWSPVRGRDVHGKTILSNDEYLSIIVSVRNSGREPVPYTSWYSGPNPAVLTDEQGGGFERFVSSRFKAIEWHIPQESVEWQQQVDDRLIFVIPPTVARDSIEAFRLELPGDAVGFGGVCRFRIPVEMIADF